MSTAFADSLINHYKPSSTIKQNEDEVNFWKNRIDHKSFDLVNLSKYAASLAARFKLLGDINDLKTSDSILTLLDAHLKGKDASFKISLFTNALSQHRFVDADSLLQKAKRIGMGKYETAAISFDVNFELGNYFLAEAELKEIENFKDYNFLFRHSKMFHYKGEIDSAIAAMQSATISAGENIPLKQAALSNTADLYLHDGRLKEAYELYKKSIKLNNADLHSLIGIGTIALLHDNNDSLAEKIFKFVHKKTKQPDAIFKLVQVYEKRVDSILQKKYAYEFVTIVTNATYGNMYNKYVLQMYTGILNESEKAEKLAIRELDGRATPQTYAWLVWSLFKNNKVDEASKIYRKHVSGKPLEGLELYWMGKYMKAINKGYNAAQFFKRAIKNKYDLSPSMISELKEISKD